MNDFNWNRYLLWLGGVLFLAWLVYWYTQREWEEKISWKPSAEFQRNPFLIAELFLPEQGKEAYVHRDLKALDEVLYAGKPDTHMVVLVDGYRALSTDQANLLRGWMREGGHLVMSLDNRFEPGRHGETRWQKNLENKLNAKAVQVDNEKDLLLAPLGVYRVEVDAETPEELQKAESDDEDPEEQDQTQE